MAECRETRTLLKYLKEKNTRLSAEAVMYHAHWIVECHWKDMRDGGQDDSVGLSQPGWLSSSPGQEYDDSA